MNCKTLKLLICGLLILLFICGLVFFKSTKNNEGFVATRSQINKLHRELNRNNNITRERFFNIVPDADITDYYLVSKNAHHNKSSIQDLEDVLNEK